MVFENCLNSNYLIAIVNHKAMINRIIKYFGEPANNRNPADGTYSLACHAPFNWHTSLLPRDPVPVDAIPDIGDNQQIVATEWMGRSPRDILGSDYLSAYHLHPSIPGVRTIRSTSMFGIVLYLYNLRRRC